VTIGELTPIIVAFIALLGGGGVIFQRRLVKKQADNAVVTGATGVVGLYEMYAARQDADILELRQNVSALESRLMTEERRCNRMEAALRHHGIEIEET